MIHVGLDSKTISAHADALFHAMNTRTVLEPFTNATPDITIDDAYAISLQVFEKRLASGEKLVGKKVGVTSLPVQKMLDVHQPDFGYLTDAMQYNNGDTMPVSEKLIAPRAEGEIAFLLAKPLKGPGVTAQDVLDATESVFACFEIVDSRIRDWKVKIQDTVADNASCGLFLLGDDAVSPHGIDFVNVTMRVYKNGELLSEGIGSEALGSPLNCVAWLANTFGERGISLDAGDIILSGSLVPLEPVKAGDSMRVEIDGIGTADVHFS